MIQNLLFLILFLKIFFRARPIKTSQKDHSFYNTVSLKKPHSFYESQLFETETNMPQNTAKKLSQFTNFPANIFLLVSGKSFALHRFLTSKNYFLEAL